MLQCLRKDEFGWHNGKHERRSLPQQLYLLSESSKVSRYRLRSLQELSSFRAVGTGKISYLADLPKHGVEVVSCGLIFVQLFPPNQPPPECVAAKLLLDVLLHALLVVTSHLLHLFDEPIN